MFKYSRVILFFSALLSISSIKAEEEKQTDPSKQEMAEYKKHCLILVNLANTYGVLEDEQERLKKEKEKKKKEREKKRSSWMSQDEEDDEDDIDEDQEEKSRILEDDNSPLGVFKKLTQKPQGVPTLSRLEKSHLQAMAKNCEDLIEVIDQYEFDVISLKGHWKVLAENKSSNMKGLAKAFVTRQKSYDKIVKK